MAVASAALLASIPAGLGAAVGLIGTAVSAFGAIQQANAASASAEYDARVADRDAVVADQNRQLALRTAQIDQEDRRRDNRRTLASIRTQYGASGLEIAGSPLDVLEDTAVEQELDVQRIGFEGRARGREGALQMLGFAESSTLSRMEASSTSKSGLTRAIGIGASGFSNTLRRVA